MTLRTVAATGGTFDIVHRGHLALLSASLEGFDHTIVGLVTDSFAARSGKSPVNWYDTRLANLRRVLERFAGCSYEICPLDDVFGPAVLRDDVTALVVSEETRRRGSQLNRIRAQKGLDGVRIVVVPMVRGPDGTRLSTTSIRREMSAGGSQNDII